MIQDRSHEYESIVWRWPTGPGAEWVAGRQRDLEKILQGKTPVYLDMNFWISMRDVVSGVETGAAEIALLNALRYGVRAGKIFCPVTAETIEELTKQNVESMAKTMNLIEVLSLGVAMVPRAERVAIEFQDFMATAWPTARPPTRSIWTAFAFAFGYEDLDPQIKGLVVDDSLVCALAEKAWNAQPSVLARTLESNAFEARVRSEATAKYLNEQNALHVEEVNNFETAWKIEVKGVCSLMEDIVHQEILRIADTEGRAVNRVSRETARLVSQMMAFSLQSPTNRRKFGSLYVPAVIHAAFRAERRKIKANDIYDFHHAAAALPYCAAFFTDGPLRTLLTSGHTALDREYRVRVVSKASEALEVLKSLYA